MNQIKCEECGNRFWPSDADGWERDSVEDFTRGPRSRPVEFAKCPSCGRSNTHEMDH